MKKTTLCIMATCLSLTVQPIQSIAKATVETAPSSLVLPKPAASAKANALLIRLDEINAMDKSKLKAFEKRNLRIEVRSIKEQLREAGGIYLSLGAIIIILLLLIILL